MALFLPYFIIILVIFNVPFLLWPPDLWRKNTVEFDCKHFSLWKLVPSHNLNNVASGLTSPFFVCYIILPTTISPMVFVKCC